MLLVWNRLVLPGGRSIVLERLPGAELATSDEGRLIRVIRNGGQDAVNQVEQPARLHRDMVAYADVLARESGQPVADPDRLIVPMLERFIATDRRFTKTRRVANPVNRNGYLSGQCPAMCFVNFRSLILRDEIQDRQWRK